MIERLPDPTGRPELWTPRPDVPRFDFESSELMRAAGITPDMSDAAYASYWSLLEGLQARIGEEVRIRATPYRTGPAAAGDFAWIDLVFRISDLAQMGLLIATVATWLVQHGALEIRASQAAIELLARWELEKKGHHRDSALIALTLTPGEGITHVGIPRPHSGYVAVFRLPDDRVVTMVFSLGGILKTYLEEQTPTTAG